MPFETSYFYSLKEHGQSGNAKVAHLVPDSSSINTEQLPDNVLMPGETFTAKFTDPAVQAEFGGDYTYIGFDPAVSGLVALGADGQTYLFSDDPGLEGETLNDIREEDKPVCFLAGTMIMTPTGEVPVETLKPGDLVMTPDGRAVRVKFLHQQTIETNPLARKDNVVPLNRKGRRKLRVIK